MDCLHNLDAERALLGDALNDACVAQQVAALPEELFTDPLTRATHRAIKRLVSQGKTPDLVTLDAEVQVDFSDTSALIALQQSGFAPSMALQHEALLWNAYKRRLLTDAAARIYQDAVNPGASVESLEIALFSALRKGGGESRSASMPQVMTELYDSLDGTKTNRMQVGITRYDTLTGGIQDGQLIYIGARPGVGKTALGLSMALHVARHSGPVLIVSLEMSLAELGARMMAESSGVDLDHLSTGRMTEADFDAVTRWIPDLARLPIMVNGRATTPLQIRREAVRMQTGGGLRLIVVDYLQLMHGDGRYGSRYEEVSDISRELKLMAMDLQVPIIAMCQLNRTSEKGFGRVRKTPPSMAEARDSGAIEQDANVFITLYEPEEPDVGTPEWDKYNRFDMAGCRWQVMNVEKNRQGPIGKIDVGFDKPHMRYRCLRTTRQEGTA